MDTLQDRADALLAQPLRENPTVADLRLKASRRHRRRLLAVGLGCGAAAILVAVAMAVAATSTDREISVASGPGDSTTVPVTYPPGYTPSTIWDGVELPTPLIEQPLRREIIQDSHDLADCTARNGYPYMKALPDTYGDGRTTGGILEVVPQFETEFQAATEACQPELQALQADTTASNTPTAFTPSPDDRPVAYESAMVIDDTHIRVIFDATMCDQPAGFTVSYQPTEVIVTMYVAPTVPDCIGGKVKPSISIRLGEPLAGRTVVDGA